VGRLSGETTSPPSFSRRPCRAGAAGIPCANWVSRGSRSPFSLTSGSSSESTDLRKRSIALGRAARASGLTRALIDARRKSKHGAPLCPNVRRCLHYPENRERERERENFGTNEGPQDGCLVPSSRFMKTITTMLDDVFCNSSLSTRSRA